MPHAIQIQAYGDPDKLQLVDLPVGEPGPGEIRIRHHACGLNFIDVYQRTGLYSSPLPLTLGMEGAGVVEAVGEGVRHLSVGDRAAYASNPPGSYSEARVMPAKTVCRLPDAIDFETGAAMMLKGLTVQYLLRRVRPVEALEPGDFVLFHAAAGGVGLIVSQWARLLGLRVIGTVSTEEKAAVARAHGCDEIINYSHEDVARRARELTGGLGVDVVFDSVGKSTFMASLDSLKRRGLLVCVGTASGPIEGFNPQLLAMKGSLYLTRPALADYIADPAEKAELAGEIFGHVAAGRIRIEINQRYALGDAVQAHRDLESRKTTGSSVFII